MGRRSVRDWERREGERESPHLDYTVPEVEDADVDRSDSERETYPRRQRKRSRMHHQP